MIRGLALGLALASSGCVTLTQLVWSGPQQRIGRAGAQHATDRAAQWREIHFDAEGLICTDVALPEVRRASLALEVEHPDGYKVATQFFTVAELLAAALVVTGKEYSCATGACGSRLGFYPWFTPLALDLVYGIYRSFTIRDEIYRAHTIEWSAPSPGPETESRPRETTGLADRLACPIGTEIPLVAGGDTLTVQIGEAGRTPPHLLIHLGAFISQHAGFGIGSGIQVRLDTSGAPLLVTAARAAMPHPPAAPPPPPPPPPSQLPTGGTIEIDVRVPVPVPRRVR